MIARSFCFAAILFVFYNLILLIEPLRRCFVVQGQRQYNVINAQEYLFAKPVKPGVVVGSSLSARLAETSLKTDFYNLSLGGDSVFTGLEIVRRSAIRPRVVLIETNMLLREENQSILSNVFCPLVSQLRPLVPGFRERYCPSTLIAGKVGGILIDCAVTAGQRICPWQDLFTTEDRKFVFAKMIDIQKADYEVEPRPEQLKGQIEKLKVLVASLEERGSRCIFFEMPIDNSLIKLPVPSAIRNSVREAFPSPKYVWVCPEGNQHYETQDGMHLSDPAANTYAEHIRAELCRHGLIGGPRSTQASSSQLR